MAGVENISGGPSESTIIDPVPQPEPEMSAAASALVSEKINDTGKGISTQQGSAATANQAPDIAFEVRFVDGDPENPHNWSTAKKFYITSLAALLVLNATFSSSAPSGMVLQLIEHFTFSQEVATLTISLFVAGYCVGPIMWGPLSEQYGRRPVFMVSFFLYACFQVGAALSPNTAAILIFRFLGGIFAAAPLSNSGAAISDVWGPKQRGVAIAAFSLAPFAGPTLGPVVSGYMNVAGVDWRWLFWVLAIFAFSCFAIILLTLPETYGPVILMKKAARKRKETGDERWWAPMDHQHVGLKKRAQNILGRPFRVLFTEPMLIAMTVYMSFIYGCIYLVFESYPIVFSEGHGFNTGELGLTFIPITVGGICAVIVSILYFNPLYQREVEQHAPNPVPPESRLTMALYGAPIFAIAFFWFAWTSYPSVSFWAPTLSGLFIGAGTCFLFTALFNYIIDAYLFVAASALSANTVVRSIFGAVFPLFATQMFTKLTPRWAGTLLGCFALLMAPIPIVLIKFGPKLRGRSKYAPKLAGNKPGDEESLPPDAQQVEIEEKEEERQERERKRTASMSRTQDKEPATSPA